MIKEVNENWINTYIKDNPFSFKKNIIHKCRQMDKADVYEWIADDELKIIELKEKVNQLEKDKIRLIEIISGLINYVKDTYDEDLTDKTAEVMEMVLDKVGGSNE